MAICYSKIDLLCFIMMFHKLYTFFNYYKFSFYTNYIKWASQQAAFIGHQIPYNLKVNNSQ